MLTQTAFQCVSSPISMQYLHTYYVSQNKSSMHNPASSCSSNTKEGGRVQLFILADSSSKASFQLRTLCTAVPVQPVTWPFKKIDFRLSLRRFFQNFLWLVDGLFQPELRQITFWASESSITSWQCMMGASGNHKSPEVTRALSLHHWILLTSC